MGIVSDSSVLPLKTTVETTALYRPALSAALADYYMPAPITPLARY